MEKLKPYSKYVQIVAAVALILYILLDFIDNIYGVVNDGFAYMGISGFFYFVFLIPIALSVLLKKNHIVTTVFCGLITLINVFWLGEFLINWIVNIEYTSFISLLTFVRRVFQVLSLVALTAFSLMHYIKKGEGKIFKFWFAPAALSFVAFVIHSLTLLLSESYGLFFWRGFMNIVYIIALALICLAMYLNSPENIVWSFVKKMFGTKNEDSVIS